MKIIMPTVSNPGLFVYDPENPTKYTEACSHAIHSVLYALSQAGYTLEMASADEFDDFITAIKAELVSEGEIMDNLIAWYLDLEGSSDPGTTSILWGSLPEGSDEWASFMLDTFISIRKDFFQRYEAVRAEILHGEMSGYGLLNLMRISFPRAFSVVKIDRDSDFDTLTIYPDAGAIDTDW